MIKHCRTQTESHKRPDRCKLLRGEWTLVFYAKQGSKKDGEMLYPEYEERTAYGALKLHSKCDYMIWTELECIIAGLMELWFIYPKLRCAHSLLRRPFEEWYWITGTFIAMMDRQRNNAIKRPIEKVDTTHWVKDCMIVRDDWKISNEMCSNYQTL